MDFLLNIIGDEGLVAPILKASPGWKKCATGPAGGANAAPAS